MILNTLIAVGLMIIAFAGLVIWRLVGVHAEVESAMAADRISTMRSDLEKRVQDVLERAAELETERDSLRELVPEGVVPLIDIAMPIVMRQDDGAQSGEWKFHQAYAAMLKEPDARAFQSDKWKIGLAIHLALAKQRTEAYERMVTNPR